MINFIKRIFYGKDKDNKNETKNIDIQKIQKPNNFSLNSGSIKEQSLNNSYLKKHKRIVDNDNISQISEEIENSKSKKELTDIKGMSSSQIGREKKKLIKKIELDQKRLNELKKYENELNKEIKNTLIGSQYIYYNNKDDEKKKLILERVREIMINVYRKNEKNLNSLFNSLDQRGFDYISEQIKSLKHSSVEEILNAKCVDNNYENKEFNNINLDENEDLIPPKKNNSKLKNIKSKIINKIEENNKSQIDIKANKSIKSTGNINNNKKNEIFGTEYFDNIQNNKKIEKKPSKNTKINQINEYSSKCLTNNLNFSIQKGIKDGNFAIELENNGLNPWPKDKTFLEIDNSKSNLNAQNIKLKPLNPGIKATVIISVNQIDKYKPGNYFICLDFKICGKKYGKSILINIEITENTNKIKYKDIIPAFRKEYDFQNSEISDTIIANALDKYHTFENAEQTIFKNKIKNYSFN